MTKAAQMFEPLLPDEVATAEAGSTAKSQPKPVPIAIRAANESSKKKVKVVGKLPN